MGAALSKEDHIDDVVAAAQRMVSSPSGSPKAAPVTKPRDTDKATRGRPGKLTRQQRNTRQANPSNLVNSADVYVS